MKSIDQAMFSRNLPCNPIPFAKELAKIVLAEGTKSIQSDKAKRILWVLMAQAYGECATISLSDEWSRLR